jgi:hypothetical protein
MWQHNKYDKRLWARMGECGPYTSGELVFVGDEGRSAYCLAQSVGPETTRGRRQSVDEASRNGNGNGNGNPKAIKVQPNPNGYQGEGERGEGVTIEF